ncbi:MAG: enoyl-CoA hydratase [Vogesella sp.]|uniref:enoyl-CoA hydratase n=1 Tax=Vogesella sp. TaxID=1904252 RepID=UPI00391A726F
MSKYIIVERLGQCAIVTINNPSSNAWTLESLKALSAAMETLDADSAVRSVVLTGAGDQYFSAGIDMNLLAKASREQAARIVDAMALAYNSIRQFRGVTVAALNGLALGSGLECALACDYIVIERGAKLGMPEAVAGLTPAAGGTKALTDRVGVPWAKRIILGGELVDADTALRIGLAEQVVDSGFAKIVAISLAGKVANQSRSAVLAARRLIEVSQQTTLDRQLLLERAAFLELMEGDEQREGVAALLAQRKPAWQDDNDD